MSARDGLGHQEQGSNSFILKISFRTSRIDFKALGWFLGVWDTCSALKCLKTQNLTYEQSSLLTLYLSHLKFFKEIVVFRVSDDLEEQVFSYLDTIGNYCNLELVDKS